MLSAVNSTVTETTVDLFCAVVVGDICKCWSQVVFNVQDCHKPPVTEDVNDPRFVWYCCKCAKNLKKIVSILLLMLIKLKSCHVFCKKHPHCACSHRQ